MQEAVTDDAVLSLSILLTQDEEPTLKKLDIQRTLSGFVNLGSYPRSRLTPTGWSAINVEIVAAKLRYARRLN